MSVWEILRDILCVLGGLTLISAVLLFAIIRSDDKFYEEEK